MPKRSSRTQDPNALATQIFRAVTQDRERQKDPAAVELGRRGGLKGGKARAEKLTSEKRKQIARKAAKARWSRSDHES